MALPLHYTQTGSERLDLELRFVVRFYRLIEDSCFYKKIRHQETRSWLEKSDGTACGSMSGNRKPPDFCRRAWRFPVLTLFVLMADIAGAASAAAGAGMLALLFVSDSHRDHSNHCGCEDGKNENGW